MRRFRFLTAAFFTLATVAPANAGAYSDWAAIVVAGDWHAHDGSPSEAFDNARRDVTAGLEHIGFSPVNIVQFSVRPQRYPKAAPEPSNAQDIGNALWDLSNWTSAGCLIYFSSHGSPDGVVLGENLLSPEKLSELIDNSCSDRPTVVFISACFSGVFVPALAAPNRLIMTAARSDRSSFGCGTDNKYPYFDTCFLETLPATHDFETLAIRTRACVADLEKKTGMSPPSEPQISVGTKVMAHLPGW